jgi:hypothetical protein
MHPFPPTVYVDGSFLTQIRPSFLTQIRPVRNYEFGIDRTKTYQLQRETCVTYNNRIQCLVAYRNSTDKRS